MYSEGILSHGCEKALKELLTVKSDYTEGKEDLMEQLITTGEYNFKENGIIHGGTRRVVSKLIEYIND